MAYPGATSVRIEVESGTDMRQAIDDIESAVARLSDIAEVHDEFQDIDLIIRHQNQPAAFVEVYRVEGEQMMDVATAVHEHIAEVIIPSLPEGVVAAIRGARRIKVPLTFAVLTSIAGAIFADDDPDKDDLEENFSDPGRFDIDRFAPPAPPTSWCRALQDRTLLVLSGQPTGALTTAGQAPIIAPLHTADGKDNGQVSVSNELYPGGRCGSDQGRRYREALRQTVEGLGGTLEGFYYAFGDDDLLLITDLPDEEAAAAFSMFVSAAGALTVSCTVLMEPETIDGAISKSVPYRKPGD